MLQGFCKTLLYSHTLAWEGPVVAGYAIPYHTLWYYRLVYELQNLASFPVLCPDFYLAAWWRPGSEASRLKVHELNTLSLIHTTVAIHVLQAHYKTLPWSLPCTECLQLHHKNKWLSTWWLLCSMAAEWKLVSNSWSLQYSLDLHMQCDNCAITTVNIIKT